MFSVGFLGWMWDAFDFFTVSLCVTEIAEDFGVSNAAVTWVRSCSHFLNNRILTKAGVDGHSDAALRWRGGFWRNIRSLRSQVANDY